MYLIFILLFLLAVGQVTTTNGQICTGRTIQSCYTNRASCRWTGTACVSGAPATCAQFLTDTQGCSGSSFGCTVQTYNGNLCADSCPRLTAQKCVGTFPVREDCRLNYNTLTCQVASPALNDGCAGSKNEAACNSTSCLFDPFVLNCFRNASQINVVFPCSYWTNFNSPNTACGYHSCVLLSSATCTTVFTTSNTLDNSTYTNYAQKVTFSSATILASTNEYRLTITVPFALSSRPNVEWPLSPSWPQIQVLFPAADVASYADRYSPQCSTLNQIDKPPPVQLNQAQYPANVLQNYILNWVGLYKNLTFNSSDPIGRACQAIYGNPLIGPNNLVTQVISSFDGQSLIYTIQEDINILISQCGSFGATQTTSATIATYTLPISYIERNPFDAYTQFTQVYISQTTLSTGVTTITSSTIYHVDAYPLQISYPVNNCSSNQAQQLIVWELDIFDVFDSTRVIGPRSISDVAIRSPVLSSGINNCYGDAIFDFKFIGCNYLSYTCTYTITTLGRCRNLTTTGDAFNFCSGAQSTDRIRDMKADVPYPFGYDGYHELYAYIWSCPVNTINPLQCDLITSNGYGNPDKISATIISSAYLPQTYVPTPFQVVAGTLPIPTGVINQFIQISDSSNINNGVQRYDGNLFSSRPITVIILMPSILRSTYDIRLNIDYLSLVATGVDAVGSPILKNNIIQTIDIYSLQSNLLYVPKDIFDAGCGAQQTCLTLPACNNTLGCDGFSIPSSILVNSLPANGYKFSMSYRIGVPTANGPGSARKLLQFTTVENRQQPTTGGFIFTLKVDNLIIPKQTCTSTDKSINLNNKQSLNIIVITYSIMLIVYISISTLIFVCNFFNQK